MNGEKVSESFELKQGQTKRAVLHPNLGPDRQPEKFAWKVCG